MFTAVHVLLGLFFLRAGEEEENHHTSQLSEERQGTRLSLGALTSAPALAQERHRFSG